MSMSIAYQILKRELEEFERMISHGITLSEEDRRRYERWKSIMKIA